MTSQVGWEDIEAELWKLGGTRLRATELTRLRRLINAYAIGVVRSKFVVPEYAPEPKPRASRAEAAMVPHDLRLTCEQCGRTGDARHAFYRKPSYTQNHGYDKKCKNCINGTRDDVAQKKGGYLCRGCKERKPLREFPEDKQKQPNLMIKCSACEPGA